MRGSIGEPDRRPSHETYLPAPEGGGMKVHEVPRFSLLHTITHGACDFDIAQFLGLDFLDVALAIAAGIESIDAHVRSSLPTCIVFGHGDRSCSLTLR